MIIETTDVEQVRLSDVPWEHARDEGEGHSLLSEWRISHEQFWEGDDLRAVLMDPIFVVDDNTLVVLERTWPNVNDRRNNPNVVEAYVPTKSFFMPPCRS